VAGPIERAHHLLPQVQQKRRYDKKQFWDGCKLILWGLFKKIVIADTLAGTVDQIFGTYQSQHSLTLLFGAIAYSFQIYGDFSGYTDIALGTAKLMGFELLSNFKFPYFSRDIAEFWRRWHISLSSWFKDYLYIPLGGSKNGKAKAVRNTFIIFLVSGFWHGASWNFITWGFIHACGFLPLLLLNKNRKHVSSVVAQESALPSLKEVWQMLSTFAFVTLAWIFFRAPNIAIALKYIKRIFSSSFQLHDILNIDQIFLPIGALLIGDWILRRDERHLSPKLFNFIIISILVWLVVLRSFGGDAVKFIYFQF